MPNWVANHITIQGENAEEVLRSLLIEREDENEAGFNFDFDFNKIIPMPESLEIQSGSTTNSCVEMYLTSINPSVDYYGENKVKADKYIEISGAMQSAKPYGRYNDHLAIEDIRALEKETYIRNGQKDLIKLTKEEILSIGKQAVDNVLTYGVIDWIDWSYKNWGTKWNACRTQLSNKAGEVYFDTAESPVHQLLLALSKKYPECVFEYEYAEEQPGYIAGYSVFEAGEIRMDERYETDSKESYETFFELWGCEDEYKFNSETGTYEYIEDGEEM